MANEIQVRSSLKVTNGSLVIPEVGGTAQNITQNTRGGGIPGQMTAGTGTNGTNVTTTGITTLGWCFLKNLDGTNYVEWGPVDSGTLYPVARLKPGESCVFRISPGKTLAVKANTADCKVQVLILED